MVKGLPILHNFTAFDPLAMVLSKIGQSFDQKKYPDH